MMHNTTKRANAFFGAQLLARGCAVALLAFSAFAQAVVPLATPDLNLVVEGRVEAIVRQPDGSVILGGEFTSVNGYRRTNLARIDPDGVLDPIWAPVISFPVRALARARDGTDSIFVGGGATFLPGYPTRLHRVAGFGYGEVDPFWAPDVGGRIDAIAVDLSGGIFIGGTFITVEGEARSRVAKLQTNVVPALDPQWSPLVGVGVTSLALDDEGAIYVGGYFSTVNAEPRSRLARLSVVGAGVLDPSWNPGANNIVYGMELADGGGIYVAGGFTQIGGEAISGVAKILTTGIVDPAWNPQIDEAVFDVSRGSSGTLYIGGAFTQIDGSPAMHVARLLEATGDVDPTWSPVVDVPVAAVLADPSGGAWIGGSFTRVNSESRLAAAYIGAAGAVGPEIDAELAGKVWAMQRHSDGTVILGGEFTKIDGEERRNLARIDTQGQLDLIWNPAINGQVRALALNDDTLYVGGEVRLAGGLSEGYLAKLSTVDAGEVDPVWTPSVDGRVEHVELSLDGSVFIAGVFTQANGLPRPGLAKLAGTGDGLVDSQWDPQPSGSVHALTVDLIGAVYVGGSLSGVGGLPAANLAKLEGDGTGAAIPTWAPWVSNTVRAIEFGPAGSIFIGGDFNAVYDEIVPGLAKLSTVDATLDDKWRPMLEEVNDARALVYVSGTDSLYAAGIFEAVSASPGTFRKMAASGDGEVDPRWRPVAEDVVALEFDGEAGLYVAGGFDQVSWVQRNSLARLPLEAGESIFGNGFEPL